MARLRRVLAAACLCLVVVCALLEGAASGPALASAAPIVIPPRGAPPSVGLVSGRVEQSVDGGTTWTPLPYKARVSPLSLVRTGADGNCILLFYDSSIVAMKPATTIQVLPQAQELRLAVLAGHVWLRFESAVPGDRNGVELPHATVAALGALDASFEVTESTATARVLDGTAAVTRDGGQQVRIATAQTVTADPGGPTPVAAFDVGLERAGWQSLLGQAGLSVTTTTFASTATSRLPPDGPVRTPWAALGVLTFLGWGALAVLAIVGTLVYLGLNRISRRRRAGR